MRTIPAELAAELTTDFNCVRHLFVFQWSTIWKWIDFDQDIYYGGDWYRSRDIVFPEAQISATPEVDSITVEIDDVDQSITNIVLSEDIKDKRALIYQVALDKNLQIMGAPDLFFVGNCERGAKDQGATRFSIEVLNDMGRWKRPTPRRTYSPTCPWDFRHGPSKVTIAGTTYTCKLDHVAHTVNRPGTGAYWTTFWTVAGWGGATWTEGDWYLVGTCRYSGGETWCDNSPDHCLTIGNRPNFGGFPYLTALQDVKIWWGRSPQVKA